ncbi:MAG: hypothetical protein AABZ60_25135 [Planctomycetota bacterium]
MLEKIIPPEEKKIIPPPTESNSSATESEAKSAPADEKKQPSRFPQKYTHQLKIFNQKEKNWISYLIRNRFPVFIRKTDGSLLENLILINFDAEESRQIAVEKEGNKVLIPKIDCVFLAKMEQQPQVLERIKKDEKHLPRLTYKTPEGEERWLFPQTSTLLKMQKNRGGVFILTDGFMVRGRLYWFTRWNIFLSLAKECEVLIFKHACMRWSILFKNEEVPPETAPETANQNDAPESSSSSNPPQ